MPILKCAWCGAKRRIEFYEFNQTKTDPHQRHREDDFLITVTCAAYGCNRKTTFEFEGMAVVGAPTRLLEGQLGGTSDMVKGFVEEATNCFCAHAYRGVAALCRSAIEQALDEKNVPGKFLDDKIDKAREVKILDDEEVSHADASRLRGRNALHRGARVTETQAALALSACIELVNHIAKQQSLPASQSWTSSSEP